MYFAKKEDVEAWVKDLSYRWMLVRETRGTDREERQGQAMSKYNHSPSVANATLAWMARDKALAEVERLEHEVQRAYERGFEEAFHAAETRATQAEAAFDAELGRSERAEVVLRGLRQAGNDLWNEIAGRIDSPDDHLQTRLDAWRDAALAQTEPENPADDPTADLRAMGAPAQTEETCPHGAVRIRSEEDEVLAERRLRDAAQEVADELFRARLQHGPMRGIHEGYAVLLEEVDELWDEVRKRHPDRDALRKEAIQVAAMGLAFALEAIGEEE
jgi:hypothetical protein